MSGIIHIPIVGAHQLTDLWNGQIEKIDIQVQNKNQLKQYIDYAKSRKIQMPESFKNGFISLKNLSRKLPHPSNILR